jgi:hypothetical protein
MARRRDVAQVQDELIDAFKWGDEARARALLSQLGEQPHEIRAVLEGMLEDSYGLARQAAAFGLGELGGDASVSRLERQLAMEEARDDYDGEAVEEDIVKALGRIDEVSARDSLVRKLERLAAGEPESAAVHVLARSLWRRRHQDLIPAVRQSLKQLSLPSPHSLHGLLVLLERSPEEFIAWVLDREVPVEFKTEALVVLEEDLPDRWVPVLPALISAAQAVSELAISQGREAAYYCERLFRFLHRHRHRLLGELPKAVLSEIRALARNLVAAPSLNCSFQAVTMLRFVGRPEDAAVIEAHRPLHPDFARDFDDVARELRGLHKN